MAEEKKTLFRQTSLDRINSPEQLNDYIRVASPGVWLFIGAVILLLGAAVLWSVFGRIETKVALTGIEAQDKIYCFVTEAEASEIAAGQAAYVNGEESLVLDVSKTAQSYGELVSLTGDAQTVQDLGIPEGASGYLVELESVGSGAAVVEVEIVTEEIQPISFVINS